MSQIEQPKSQPAENIDNFMQLIAQKGQERRADFVQNPLWPGLELRKTGTMRRIEAEFAPPWENIVDFLTRKYRVEQTAQGPLAKELSINPKTISRLLKQLGIPKLQSFEYRDLRARRMAKLWEDSEKRARIQNEHRKTWQDNYQRLLESTHTPQANTKIGEASSRWHRENPKEAARILAAAWQANREKKAARIKAALGKDPAARLRELLIDQNLTYKDTARIIGENISEGLLKLCAKELGVISPERRKKYGIAEIRSERAREIADYRQFFDRLAPARSASIIDALYPENSKPATFQEIGMQFGVTRERIRQIEGKALQKLRALAQE